MVTYVVVVVTRLKYTVGVDDFYFKDTNWVPRSFLNLFREIGVSFLY